MTRKIDRERKAEMTNDVAFARIEAEQNAVAAKTERLRALRLAQAAAQAGKPSPARTSK